MSKRFRKRTPKFQLCAAVGAIGMKVVRRVSFEEGMKLVDEKKAERVFGHGDVSVIGFRMLPERTSSQVIVVVAPESRPSSAGISRSEVEANAGLRGVSRTASMTEEQRKYRIGRGLPEMDLIEASRHKVAAYQTVH